MKEFSIQIIKVIQSIPKSKVLTYKAVAEMAGNPYGSRQVSRILHSCSEKYQLPWHRIVNSKGSISLSYGAGYELQEALLKAEGVKVDSEGKIDLETYLWKAE
ncbi:MAG TPA: MGMT family protein [Candidatus Cloacimonadota bacterium]|nr:MGMT family protein [Candidatus Cloacimonadota bacterium]HPM00695.1 MGMT family protein [Candidatus Cloacimonadota bacterium]